MGKFRAPSLRNIAVTGPICMTGRWRRWKRSSHLCAQRAQDREGPNAGDGALSPLKSPLIVKIDLTPQEKADCWPF